jgi:hypothetical protein
MEEPFVDPPIWAKPFEFNKKMAAILELQGKMTPPLKKMYNISRKLEKKWWCGFSMTVYLRYGNSTVMSDK